METELTTRKEKRPYAGNLYFREKAKTIETAAVRLMLIIISMIFASALILLIPGCAGSGKNVPRPEKGSIDLSEWDFKSNDSVKIEHNWEFYPGSFIDPGKFGNINRADEKKFIQLSGIAYPGWKLFIPEYYLGYATYRMKIITDKKKADNLSLQIHTINAAYKLFINGEFVHQNGRAAAGSEIVMHGFSASLIPLHSADGIYEIVIHAVNYTFPAGGIDYDIDIGSTYSLQRIIERINLLEFFLLIVIIIIALNQLVIFTLHNSERQYLYLGLCCLCTIFYNFGQHYIYWGDILPFFPWDSTSGILKASVYAGDIFFFAYLRRLFPKDVPMNFLFTYTIVNGILGLGIAVLPEKSFAYFFSVYMLHAVASVLIFFVIAVRVIVLRRKNFMLILTGGLAGTVLGLLIYFLTVFDVISGDGDINYMLFSIVTFCLVQAFGTTRDFIRTHRRFIQADTGNNLAGISSAGKPRVPSNVITDIIESKINASIDYLRANFTSDISRENLASKLDLHPDNFSRYFRLHTGKKYVEYLNDLRVEEAARLLKETDLSIDDIVEKSGFRSSRTFNHAFIKATGQKPSNYRNN